MVKIKLLIVMFFIRDEMILDLLYFNLSIVWMALIYQILASCYESGRAPDRQMS